MTLLASIFSQITKKSKLGFEQNAQSSSGILPSYLVVKLLDQIEHVWSRDEVENVLF